MPSIPIGPFDERRRFTRPGTLGYKIVLDYEGRDCAASTVRQVERVLRELMAVGVARSYQIDNEAIALWRRAWPDRSTETWKSNLRCLSAVCTIAKFEGYLRKDPFELHSVKKRVRDDARPKTKGPQYHRTPEEIRKVLELAAAEAKGGDWEAMRLSAYTHALFLTGARPGEIQHLLAANVDFRRGTIRIEPVQVPVRGGRTRWWRPKTVGSSKALPAGPRLLEILEAWERVRLVPRRQPRYRIPIRRDCPFLFPGKSLVGPWTCGGPGVRPLDQIRELGERAGVADLVNKSARKSVGTHAKTIGLGGLERKALFRHADLKTGEAYDEEDAETLRPAVKRIEQYYLGTGA